MPKATKKSSKAKKAGAKTTKSPVATVRRKAPARSSLGKAYARALQVLKSIGAKLLIPVRKLRQLRSRRTHKTFKRSRRRDYIRKLKLPGYIKFTGQVFATLGRNKKLFGGLTIVATLLALVLSGLSSQQLYSSIVESVTSEGEDVPGLIRVGTLVASTAGLLTSSTSEVQQIYIGIIGLITWLTTVWLLREIMAGQRPRLRDGLYSAGSPIVATAIVAVLLLLQLLPIGLLAIIYTALASTGMINEGLGAFLFFGVAALVITLTLYWITSTLLAMVIITLPGMYPWQAMRAASDIIVGRRLKILYRIIWMLIIVVLMWAIVMTPTVILNSWLVEKISWFNIIPLVPTVATWLTMTLAVWAATYVYSLYRKVVASDAESGS